MNYYLGIEIGGTKLQLGVGADDGVLAALWRGAVDASAGPEGIRRQITQALPELLAKANIDRSRLKGVGIGFGGPVDDATRTVIKSHQIEGWDRFPLADWMSEVVGLPAALGNDADVAGLAEALHGAGKGLSPIFYITIGSGIGGGFIIDGEIYRGVGRGAAEIGHLKFWPPSEVVEYLGITEDYITLESIASGWAIEQQARRLAAGAAAKGSLLLQLVNGQADQITTQLIGEAASRRDPFAKSLLDLPRVYLADAISQVITLLCPRRIILGGGVSLMLESCWLGVIRELVYKRVFEPYFDVWQLVSAALGEEVVVHGAIALARRRLG
jgi:glucokinase